MQRVLAIAWLSIATLSSCGAQQGPAPGEGGSLAECRGPGRYEAGKEGSYKPCCAGLNEVPQQSPAEGAGRQKICTSPPLNVYACVKGSCGDGVCEAGESEKCGCVADCPSAAWAEPAAPDNPVEAQ